MSKALSQIVLSSPSLLSLLHPDVVDFAARIRNKGASISYNDLLIVDRFVKDIYANNLRAFILECYPFVGDSIAAARTKLWHTGTEAFINNGFTSANYGRATGITGNGSSFLNSNFVPSATSSLTNTNGSIGVYNRSNIFESRILVGCADSNGNSFNLIVGWSDNFNYFDSFTLGVGVGRLTTPSSTDCLGFHVGSRISATDSRYFQRGNQIASITTSGGNLPTVAQHWFVYNNNGTINSFSTKSIGFGFIGRGLTPTQVSVLTRIVNQLMTDLGRAV